MEKLKTELQKVKQELGDKITHLENKLFNISFTIDRFKHNKVHFKFYTGFETYELFQVFFSYVKPEHSLKYWGSTNKHYETSPVKKQGRGRIFNFEEELFLTLTRLRCGFPVEDLAIRFNVSSSTISRILITWLDYLHIHMRALPIWASKKTVQDTMPQCFKDMYPNTRVIIDCTEIFTEMPSSYRSQSATFSNYKHHNTAKGLVGISPNGAITFVSELYAGRSTDKQITKHCGILELLERGDDVMADRGFDIQGDLPEGVSLNIPPFLEGKNQLSLQKEIETRRIASVRVHVERAIERIKNYRILQTKFQLSMASDLNKIWVTCCYLVNFLPPLIVED